MNFLTKKIALFLFAILFLTACNKDNIDEVIPGDPGYQPDTVVVNSLIFAMVGNPSGGLDLGCITINFPFSLLTESGATVEINTEAEFEAATDSTAADPVVDIVFPLSITDSDGNASQVNDETELGVAFASCIPTTGWVDTTSVNGTYPIPAFLFEDLCFDLVYPVDVEDADENTYTANNEAALIDLLATTSNLTFVLPITVLDEQGNETVIESAAGFFDLYYACDGVIPPGTQGGIPIDLSDLDSANCDFESLAIQYPYDVVTDDGDLITVADANQEAALILSGVHYTVQYPFSLVDADGEVVTINDDLEFIQLILPCLVTIEEPDPCSTPAHVLLYFNQGQAPFQCGYLINFPTQVEAEGTVYDLNDMFEYYNVYGPYSNQIDKINIIYPVSVTDKDGNILTFNNDNDVCQFIDGC
ncbi:MAG: hypothetical protein KDD27_21005 [Saprospiraceae bacterium]|nr:hypothetical protein [Saprospiraceae bacterium]